MLGKYIAVVTTCIEIVFILLSIFIVYISQKKSNLYIITSGSMEPVIATGSILHTHFIQAQKLKVGDIITYKEEGEFVTHRIKEILHSPLRFRTKGDANNAHDNREVLGQDIIGRVEWSIPYLGYVLNFFRTPVGFVLFVFLPLCFFFLLEVFEIIRFARRHVCKE